MTELMDLQHQFQKFLLSGASKINDSVVQTETLAIAERLAIYKDAYKLRLIESLTTNFPATYAYLGTDEFQKLCSSYIEHHPSTYRSIRWYGHALAGYLKSYYLSDYAYLAELAELEWNMTLVFDAADDPLLSLNEMAVVSPESWAGMQFVLHSSVRRLNYFWNVVPIWQKLIHDGDLPEWYKTAKPTPWVLWRTQDNLIHYYSLSNEEAWALDTLNQGLSFGALCEGLGMWLSGDDIAMRAATFLKNWIHHGMISHLVIAE